MKFKAALFVLALALCVFALAAERGAPMPVYKVDPFWPKPLPNKWLIQGVPTMVTDKDDHIWVLNRPRDIMPDEAGAASTPPRTDCCIAAPAVLEFDTAGNLLKSWGGPGYTPGWPAPGVARPGPGAEHNIQVDRQGNVWISGSGRGDSIQKFTADGKLLWDFGHRGPPPPNPASPRRHCARIIKIPTRSRAGFFSSTWMKTPTRSTSWTPSASWYTIWIPACSSAAGEATASP